MSSAITSTDVNPGRYDIKLSRYLDSVNFEYRLSQRENLVPVST